MAEGMKEREGRVKDGIQIPEVGDCVKLQRWAGGRPGQLHWPWQGDGTLYGSHEEPLKVWKLRKKFGCIYEHQQVTGGSRWMLGKGRQGPQEQFAPGRRREGALRPERAEPDPA